LIIITNGIVTYLPVIMIPAEEKLDIAAFSGTLGISKYT
jgi:hypothetical protein